MAKVKVKDLLQKLVGNNVNYQTYMEVEKSEVIDSNLPIEYIEEQKLSGVQVMDIGGVGIVDTYKDGLLDGVSETFYHTGGLSQKKYFKRGKLHGCSETYRPDGTLKWRRYFENGIEIENKEN